MQGPRYKLVGALLVALMLVAATATAQAQRPDDEGGTPAEPSPQGPSGDEGGVGAESHGETGDFDDFVSIRNQTGTGRSRLNLNTTDSIVVNEDTWRLSNNAETGNFELSEGANTNRMVMRQGGNLGLGTDNPLSPLHIERSGGFQLRMQGSGADYRMDSFGTSLRIGDSSNTNQFRIFGADAPFNALTVGAGIGVGTSSPEGDLDVRDIDGDGNAAIKVDSSGAATANRVLGDFWNNGGAFMRFINRPDSGPNQIWRFGNNPANEFTITNSNEGGFPKLDGNGDLRITGAYLQSSDRKAKESIEPAAGETVLSKLRELPISTWQYKSDPNEARHLGPMAQDFKRVFGLGTRRKFIAPADMAGVALSSIKELDRKLRGERKANRQLKDRLARVEKRLDAMESR